MSLLHKIFFDRIMKQKTVYTPGNAVNYKAIREEDERQNAQLPVKRNSKISTDNLGGVPVEYVRKEINPKDKIILYIHGGGFVQGSSKARRPFTTYIADKLGYDVVSVDYRLAPEFPFPAAPDDCLTVYTELQKKFGASNIVLMGESAGGNLVLATLLQAKAKKIPLPSAVFAFSPTVQYDTEFPSYTENTKSECMVGNLSAEVCDTYLQTHDPTVLKNPIAAPYYGEYDGCPPIFLWASKTEVLRDDSIYFYKKLRKAGQPCRLYLRDNMMHAYQIFTMFPETHKDIKIIRNIIEQVFSNQCGNDWNCIELK